MKKIYLVMVVYNENTENVQKGTKTISAAFLSEKKAIAFKDYWNKLYDDVAIHYIVDLPIVKTDYSKFSIVPF